MPIKKYIINHVMSKDIDSGIFSAILSYFKKYSPDWIEHIESTLPINNADIYHYHRPHLETKLKENSVCTVHHDLNDLDIWHSRQRFIPRYNESSAVICLNSTQKEILKIDEGLKEDKLYIVPHGYNNEVLRRTTKTRDSTKKFTIGIASRRYGRRVKGEAYLSELVKRLDPDIIKFVLVGQDRSIDAVDFRSLGFEVDVFERLPYRIFQGFYSEIDALLMCSSHEGGPANIPEALATGTPVFSTPIGMSLDFIKHEENGLFLTLDPDEDAELIEKNAKNIDLFRVIESKCQEYSSNIPTWRDSIFGNLKIYSKIIEKNILTPTYIEENPSLLNEKENLEVIYG
ncbi:glycosyltransferase family 4 protein [Comamonas composti]|uniref:glycosyltransferase family 4 protein n=1 Tax=Comamonas composti TaxID=408558 RepID=UPI000A03C3BF|nr:glycosyltransferase family 4 protein [Comamonas composti]